MSERDSSGNLAIFDLDETLTIRGTWGRFVNFVILRRYHIFAPIMFILTWGAAGIAQACYKFGSGRREDAKIAMIKWALRGLKRERVEAWGDAFAAREVANGLRPGAIRALAAHKDAGDMLMIISAGSDLVVEPIARRLGIIHVICTRSAWKNDRLDAKLGSKDCYAGEKLVRLRAYQAAHPNVTNYHGVITMYSDSHSDIEILRNLDVGVCVNPDRKLREYARIYDLPIQDWMKL